MKTFVWTVGVLVALVLGGCDNPKQSVAAYKDNLQELKGRDKAEIVIGEYRGVMPCADCDGIETLISLHPDNTYKYSSKYLNKSEDVFVREGKWKLDGNIITLDGVDYKFKLGNHVLSQLDLSGNDITGDISKYYVLTKN
ncbi:copper resistance protein NlpE [Sphingobacterium thalpophilum]|uniref:Copper homeostasis protein CutF n=1 Tax=Sphingobacterium thalpophilum TaxID=259 RepID=A0A4U9VBI2_9SPHI|nr:copper resistance protein NlpE [Sphingobacterium thalpophilum]VTR42559.1 Copper homeostasis protein CutF [Sphingobacterium thalpophilum]